MRCTLVLVLLLALLAGCAGPRLVSSATTAHLPAPAVRRVDTPRRLTDGVPWPVRAAPKGPVACAT